LLGNISHKTRQILPCNSIFWWLYRKLAAIFKWQLHVFWILKIKKFFGLKNSSRHILSIIFTKIQPPKIISLPIHCMTATTWLFILLNDRIRSLFRFWWPYWKKAAMLIISANIYMFSQKWWKWCIARHYQHKTRQILPCKGIF
jgi:hypothetical protein